MSIRTVPSARRLLRVRLAALRRSAGRLRSSDRGSIMPLALGFTTIALAAVLLAVVITDIYLAQRTLFALADSAALAAADSFEPRYRGIGPHVEFSDAQVRTLAQSYLAEVPDPERFGRISLEGRARDDATVEVTLRTRFRPVALSPFVPNGITLEATGVSRGGLRLGE